MIDFVANLNERLKPVSEGGANEERRVKEHMTTREILTREGANPILSITMKDAHEAVVYGAQITDNLWIIQFVLPGIGDVNLYFRSANDARDLLARAFRTLISTERKNYEAYYEYETP